ncbi:MAG: penicillin-binding transpeptidase domain-containing protein [Bermanella sp.]
MSTKNQYENSASSWRHYTVMLLGLSFFALLLVRLTQLQILQTDFLQGESDRRSVRDHKIHAFRGMVIDRNGEPLAVSTPVKSIWLNPKQIIKDEVNISPLAQYLNITESQLKNKILKNKNKEFIYLQRHMSPLLANKIEALNIPGVGLQQESKRFYPAAEVTSHVVGFTNIDEQGIEGIELAFDEWLKGKPGKGRMVKDRLGRLVKDLGVMTPALPGNELMLSIDLRLQYQAYRELKASVQQHGAKAGSLIMVDVKSGEILALVNQPAFNPNNRSHLNVDAVRNRTVTDIFEPGSTVKPFTVAAALMAGQITPRTIINTHPGYLRIGNKTIRDHRNYGELDIAGILTKSSNVGISKIALELGGENIWRLYQSLGLGKPVGLGLPGEHGGKIAVASNNWNKLQSATLAYGYGLAVTPLQLAQAYQVLANGGVKQPLSLIHKTIEPGQQVLPSKVAGQVLTMLQGVVAEKGTARRAKVEGYRVSGKTGTVHKVGSKGYEDDHYLSLFAGIAPAINPKIVTIVVVDDPGGREYYGGEVAAPIFSRVTQASLRLLNVAPTEIDGNSVVGGIL